MKQLSFTLVLLFSLCCVFNSCKKSQDGTLPEPRIKCGTARLSGQVVGYMPDSSGIEKKYYLRVPQPITVDGNLETEIKVDKEGAFRVDVPVDLNLAVATMRSDDYEEYYVVGLSPDKETKIELYTDAGGKKRGRQLSGTDFVMEDCRLWGDLMRHMAQHASYYEVLNKDSLNRFITDPNSYIPFTMKYSLEPRLQLAKNDSLISERGRDFMSNEFRLTFMVYTFFDFPGMINLMYTNIRGEGDTTTLTVPEPDKSYYVFLKELNLDNPLFFYHESYSWLIDAILRADALGIPKIEETPVDVWMKEVKGTLSDLVGFDSGMFYDMLAANAYTRQFNDELRPLSDRQKENITAYWGKEGEITKLLSRKNNGIVEIAKDHKSVMINDTPAVPKEKLMDAIIAKYEGKVVLVDFWATWCAPCMAGMKKMIPLKSELKDKDVVFVYITNSSSPAELWNDKIKGIGGEQYYLDGDEWDYILDSMDFSGIPTYLFYGKDGKLVEKITGYPGTENMQEIIGKLL